MSETKFYQIRLFSRGEIEIFQNVFNHAVKVDEKCVSFIRIKYSSSKNTGSYTVSDREITNVYDLQIVECAEFLPNEERPLDKKITIYGNGKPKRYFPDLKKMKIDRDRIRKNEGYHE